jgi:hypothetical protein
MNGKRILVAVLLALGLAAAFALPGLQLAGGPTERLANGDFEAGFYDAPPGRIGAGWHWFHNGGEATYGFYDETWTPVIHDGQHSQLIEINTFSRGGSDPDRYAGIYQTVAVEPGETYDLSLYGMLRVREDDPDRSGYNYRVQYAIDQTGGSDWTAVDDWVEIPWDAVHPRLSPGAMASYTTTVTASGERLTLFVRAWKKWATAGRELDVNLDAISLRGAMPTGDPATAVHLEAPAYPVAGWTHPLPVMSSSGAGVTRLEFYDDGLLVDSLAYDVGLLELAHGFSWTPATAGSHTLRVVAYDGAGGDASHEVAVLVGAAGQFLANGDFEGGFHPTPAGEVGDGWGWFHNGGQATYGFYDETWESVIYDGAHAQLIEINTFCRAASDPDRFAGIYQAVEGLTPGATYRLSLHGMLRARAGDADRENFGYRLQWGYDPAGGTDWRAVENWLEIPWDTVYERLSPGTLDGHTASFVAPSARVTLFFRAWKKWGTAQRELDVNLDAITLEGYE